MCRLICGDCMELLPEIQDGSVDMVLCDMPYGSTQNTWDQKLPLDKLWEQYSRIVKELGSIDCLRKLAGGPGETSTITNGGKIRAMDDDRLAQEILRRWRAEMEAGKFEDISTRWCDMKGGCVSSKGYPRPCTEDRLLACIKRWLQQPAEG